MTSFARCKSDGGIVRARALAGMTPKATSQRGRLNSVDLQRIDGSVGQPQQGLVVLGQPLRRLAR
jgi:hypothetical protein